MAKGRSLTHKLLIQGYKRHNQVNQANSMVRVRVRLAGLSKYIKTIHYIGICMRVSTS